MTVIFGKKPYPGTVKKVDAAKGVSTVHFDDGDVHDDVKPDEMTPINGKGETNGKLEKNLFAAADQLWANSSLKPSEYSAPVLGLIFLRYADQKFAQAEKELAGKSTGCQAIGKTDYQACGAGRIVPTPSYAASVQPLEFPN